jgi:hypothetical protein
VTPIAGEMTVSGDGIESSGRRRRRLLRRWLVSLLVLVVAVVGVGAWAAADESNGEQADSPAAPRTVAEAQIKTLAETEEVKGTLGHPEVGVLSSGRSGTVTWLPVEGDLVDRGGVLFRVDGSPVVLLFGDVPLYRQLAIGVSRGEDVRQLEQNLVDLGYADRSLTVDDQFTSATASAVRRWQAALGIARTGTVEVGDAVFLPSAVRVGEHAVSKGARVEPGATVADLRADRKVVTVSLEARLQQLAVPGAPVVVTLPDGTEVAGRITSVGRIATTPEGEEDPAIDVLVELDDPAAAGSLDEAPVEVTLTREAGEVLAVPVTALLALADGGFAVEVVDGSATRVVTVQTGLFAQGYVEISGQGIEAGTRVVVPR